jgi:uncharacterized membrane protein YGL010W
MVPSRSIQFGGRKFIIYATYHYNPMNECLHFFLCIWPILISGIVKYTSIITAKGEGVHGMVGALLVLIREDHQLFFRKE